jgi:1-deoxy-D-xylulose-5-phosphate reductoisomerase
MRHVAVVGATGVIGNCALDLIRLQPDGYRASVLTAYRDVETLTALCARHRPDLAVIADPALEKLLSRHLAAAGVHCEVASGADALVGAVASGLCDTVLAAIPGISGVAISLAAARAGKRLLLADRESAVMAGPLLRQALADGRGELIPIDAGLLAAFQCLFDGTDTKKVERLTLAGSGGPFLGLCRAELMTVVPDQLCNPSERATRRKAAVDSASLMDRGLQLIAAHHLFQLAPEQIEVMIHPRHQIHAQAAYTGGTVRTLAGPSNPHESLSLALTWPQTGLPSLEVPPLLERPDLSTFRCLALSYQALQAGGDAPMILNAANAVAADAFLAGSWPFLSIADMVEQVLTELPPQAVVDIQTLSERDRAAREAARQVLRNAC